MGEAENKAVGSFSLQPSGDRSEIMSPADYQLKQGATSALQAYVVKLEQKLKHEKEEHVRLLRLLLAWATAQPVGSSPAQPAVPGPNSSTTRPVPPATERA